MDPRTRDLLRLQRLAKMKADVMESKVSQAARHEAMAELLEEEQDVLERLMT